MAEQKSIPLVPNAPPSERKPCVVLAGAHASHFETAQISGWLIGRLIKPLLEAPPYSYRVDIPTAASGPGRITARCISQIARADLVVADLTGHPPDVFYCLAAAHTLKKKTLHLMMKGQPVPFDHKECRVLFYDIGWLEDSAQASRIVRDALTALLAATPTLPSPIAAAHAFHLLERGKDPRGDAVADLARQVNDLRVKLARLEERSAQQAALPPALTATLEEAIRTWEGELENMKRLRRSLENDRIATELEKLRRYDEAALHHFPAPSFRA